MAVNLPREIQGRDPSLPAAWRALLALVHDLRQLFLALPRFEFRTIEVDGNFPVSVQTEFLPTHVLRGQTYETGNPGRILNGSGISWHLSDNQADPGIVIDDVGGVTLNTSCTCELLLLGKRTAS